MSINLALHDAANNCARANATAILTLRSGAVITGALQKPTTTFHEDETAHVLTATGWATVMIAEIVAVEARR